MPVACSRRPRLQTRPQLRVTPGGVTPKRCRYLLAIPSRERCLRFCAGERAASHRPPWCPPGGASVGARSDSRRRQQSRRPRTDGARRTSTSSRRYCAAVLRRARQLQRHGRPRPQLAARPGCGSCATRIASPRQRPRAHRSNVSVRRRAARAPHPALRIFAHGREVLRRPIRGWRPATRQPPRAQRRMPIRQLNLLSSCSWGILDRVRRLWCLKRC